MFAIANFDRIDVVFCGLIAFLLAIGFGMTKDDASKPSDAERSLSRIEKIMIWTIVAMFCALLFACLMRR